MMQGNRYTALLILYAVIFVVVMTSMPKQINWNASFSNLHKIPYGCYVLYQEIDDLFSDKEVLEVSRPIYNVLPEVVDKTSYVFINEALTPDQLDVESLLDFVGEGNEAMFIGQRFSYHLLDTLGLRLSTVYRTGSVIDLENSSRDWHQSFLTLERDQTKRWAEQRDFEVTYFDTADLEDHVQVLGHIDSVGVNFLRLPFGDGIVYFNTSPYMYTNFNFLNNDNHEYVASCLSYLSSETILWDEYYKLGRTPYDASPLSTLLKNQSARTGIYLGLIGILLYILFHVKRRQRIIPVIKPYRNSSLDFAQTLGDLYYEQGNHQDLAEKKIHYLKDYLHEHYRMSNIEFTDKEIDFVSAKSGHSEEMIRGLFKLIKRVQNGPKIGVEILDRLTKKLQTFYHRNN